MARRGKPIHGWVVLDKPYGMSSTQAVGKVRWLFEADKAGHGGTLDPLATGLLPIALGEATKTVPFAMDGHKTYQFEVVWGEERATDDLEGAVTAQSTQRPDTSSIQSILKEFTGEISQMPPVYSALKIEGKRAYDLARAGAAVDLKARLVMVHSLTLLSDDNALRSRFEVACGKGTYVRALARDFGRKLGCLGYVSQLRRVRVGPFRENQMISLETLEEMRNKPPSLRAEGLLPLETVLDGIPAFALSVEEARRLKQGQMVLLGQALDAKIDTVLATYEGSPLGLCHIEQGALKPKRLFNL